MKRERKETIVGDHTHGRCGSQLRNCGMNKKITIKFVQQSIHTAPYDDDDDNGVNDDDKETEKKHTHKQ